MTIKEYNEIKDLTYNQYCNYLKNKYGTVPFKYGNTLNNRSDEGLFIHHIKEDTVANLSDHKTAKKSPKEYQQSENLTYCNYLEHLLLHIIIGEELSDDKNIIGIGGAAFFMIPYLRNFYDYGTVNDLINDEYFNVIKSSKEIFDLLFERFNRVILDKHIELQDLSHKLNKVSGNTHFWSDEEVEKFIEDYKKYGTKCVELYPNRSKGALVYKAYTLGIKSNRTMCNNKICDYNWSEEELEIFKKYFPLEACNVYKRLKNKSKRECARKAKELNIQYDKHKPLVKLGKKIKCIESNEIFNSISEASRKYSPKSTGNMHRALKNGMACGELSDGTKLHWEYIEEGEVE